MTTLARLTLTAAAAAGALASLGAQAQSKLEIGGIADVAVRVVENANLPRLTSMVSGANNTSRLFFRGSENLGAGLSAGFHLEMGIQFQNGTQASSVANQLFDRRAVVSLDSQSWGSVLGGRDYVPTYSTWVANDPFSHVGVAGTNNLASATPTGPIRAAFGTSPNVTVRANDAVQWVLPKNSLGLEGGVFAGLRANGAVADGKNDVQGFRLAGSLSGVRLSVAQATTSNSLTTVGDFKDTVMAVSTTVAGVRLSAAQRKFSYDKAKQTNTLLAAIAPVPGGQLKFSWLQADFDGSVGTTNIGANSTRLLGLGYVYTLSPRTALYANASRISNQGAVATAVPGGAAGLAAGASSQGYELGIRHNF